MEFTIAKPELLSLVKRIAQAAAVKAPVPMLDCLLLSVDGDTLTATATDLVVAARASKPCDAKKKGAVAVNAKTFVARVESLPNDRVSVKAKETRLWLRAGSREFVLETRAASDFPETDFAHVHPVALPAAVLAESVRVVEHAAGTDETRPNLTLVTVDFGGDVVTSYATDGHRLARYRAAAKTEALKLEVPSRALPFARALEGFVTVSRGEKRTVFETPDGIVSFANTGASGPPYEQVIPQSHEVTTRVARSPMLDALKAAQGVGSNHGTVNVAIAKGEAVLSAMGPSGEMQDKLPVECDGKAKFAVRAPYLADAIAACGADEVELRTAGALDPIVVCAENLTCVVMPIRE